MAEIDVTHMVEDADDMPMLSGSIAELGNNAARITWNNSVAYGREHPLLTDDELKDAARDHFAEYGAWSREEIDAWSDDELEGITSQEVAANIREMGIAKDYDDFVRLCEAGTLSGRLYRGDDGHWYYYLGT